ncbi:MAG TPA: hypothetical protein VES38_02220 [Methylotenera sp.]|nr:hypothetical protein [Methylotenera sp.]
MKLGFIVFALAASFSATAYAYECNTVMGGCPTDTTQATSTHMRSDPGIKSVQQAKVPNKAVATPTTATHNKLESKKSTGQGLMQTIK